MLVAAENNYRLGVGMKRAKQRAGKKFAAPCRVTTDDVLQCAKGFGPEISWTTREIAEALNVEEYSIRAAVFWLEKRKLVEAQPVPERRYTAATHCPYSVTTYKVVEKGGAPDIAALELALGFCRAFL